VYLQVALSDTGIPKVNVSLSAASDEEPEVDVSNEEFLQFDTSSVPVIVTLTKVICVTLYYLVLSRHMLYSLLQEDHVDFFYKWSNYAVKYCLRMGLKIACAFRC